jgi:hypothetical protein
MVAHPPRSARQRVSPEVAKQKHGVRLPSDRSADLAGAFSHRLQSAPEPVI